MAVKVTMPRRPIWRLFTDVERAWDAADLARLTTLVAPELLNEWERRLTDFLAVLGWGHLALYSARNIPIFSMVAAPVTAQAFMDIVRSTAVGDIAERIRALNLDNLRPIEALQLLADLQKELKR